MSGMHPVVFSLHEALTGWNLSIFPAFMAAVLVATAIWYLRGDWMLAGRGRRWSGKRTASFIGGLVAIEIAVGSPVATLTAVLLPGPHPPAPVAHGRRPSAPRSRRAVNIAVADVEPKDEGALAPPPPQHAVHAGIASCDRVVPLLRADVRVLPHAVSRLRDGAHGGDGPPQPDVSLWRDVVLVADGRP